MTTVFVSYSHLDHKWFDRGNSFALIPYLENALRRDGATLWYDRSDEMGLQAGDDFQHEILAAIDQSEMALLLISEAFFASDFISRVELPRILERAERKEIVVVPVLLEPCDWQDFEFISSRQMLPGEPTPLSRYMGDESKWAEARHQILSGMRRVLHERAARTTALRSSGPIEPGAGPGRSEETGVGNDPWQDGQRRRVSEPIPSPERLPVPPGLTPSRRLWMISLAALLVFVAGGGWWLTRGGNAPTMTVTPAVSARAGATSGFGPQPPPSSVPADARPAPQASTPPALATTGMPPGATARPAFSSATALPASPGVTAPGTARASAAPSSNGISMANVGQVTQLAEIELSASQVVWSPDGSLLAGAAYEIEVYDTKTWKLKRKLDTGGWSGGVAFSPDGKLLAAAAGDKVWVRNVTTGGEVVTFPNVPNAGRLAFAPDGKRLASISGSVVRFFEIAGGRELDTLPGNGDSLKSLAYSPDGKWLAVAGSTIQLYAVDGATAPRTLSGPGTGTTDVVFSSDGSTLASSDWNHSATLWEVATGKELVSFTGHSEEVDGVSISPDGSLLATVSWDLTVRLWDATSGDELRSLRGHSAWIKAVAFSPDGTRLASADSGGSLRIWGLAGGNSSATAIRPAGPPATPIPLSPSAITAANAAQLQRRALPTGSPYKRSLTFSPDGKVLAVGDNSVLLLAMPSGTAGRETRSNSTFSSLAFSPDGTKLAMANLEGIKLWDPRTGADLGSSRSIRDPESIAYSPDGGLLAVATGMVTRLVDGNTLQEIDTLAGHTQTVNQVALSPDGRLVAAAGVLGLELWDLGARDAPVMLDTRTNQGGVAFSPDGTKLASLASDAVRLYDPATKRMVLEIQQPMAAGMAFSPDGKLLATTGEPTVKIWDVATGNLVATLKSGAGATRCPVFSPDGSLLVAANTQGMDLWALAGAP